MEEVATQMCIDFDWDVRTDICKARLQVLLNDGAVINCEMGRVPFLRVSPRRLATGLRKLADKVERHAARSQGKEGKCPFAS